MSAIDQSKIEAFLHGQVAAWNAGDKEAFLDRYRDVAPKKLTIQYPGQEPADGWAVLEGMWAQQNEKVEIEEVVAIINGNEAACHNRNKVKGTDMAIETIELYTFDADSLFVRYYIRQP